MTNAGHRDDGGVCFLGIEVTPILTFPLEGKGLPVAPVLQLCKVSLPGNDGGGRRLQRVLSCGG